MGVLLELCRHQTAAAQSRFSQRNRRVHGTVNARRMMSTNRETAQKGANIKIPLFDLRKSCTLLFQKTQGTIGTRARGFMIRGAAAAAVVTEASTIPATRTIANVCNLDWGTLGVSVSQFSLWPVKYGRDAAQLGDAIEGEAHRSSK